MLFGSKNDKNMLKKHQKQAKIKQKWQKRAPKEQNWSKKSRFHVKNHQKWAILNKKQAKKHQKQAKIKQKQQKNTYFWPKNHQKMTIFLCFFALFGHPLGSPSKPPRDPPPSGGTPGPPPDFGAPGQFSIGIPHLNFKIPGGGSGIFEKSGQKVTNLHLLVLELGFGSKKSLFGHFLINFWPQKRGHFWVIFINFWAKNSLFCVKNSKKMTKNNKKMTKKCQFWCFLGQKMTKIC